jgi:hypothetical protein
LKFTTSSCFLATKQGREVYYKALNTCYTSASPTFLKGSLKRQSQFEYIYI